MQWEQGPGGTVVLTQTTAGSTVLGLGISSGLEGTIVRLRGLVDFNITSATSPGDGYFGAVGIGIVGTPAFAAGVASMITPLDEISSAAWLWHSFFSVHEASADGQGSGSSFQRIEIDSKAMRIFPNDVTLFMVAQFVEIGTAVVAVHANTRMLIMNA